MKVKELIALLEQQPQENTIEFYNDTEEMFMDLESIEQNVLKNKLHSINLNFTY